MGKKVIMGAGNLLLKDEGIGVHVVHEMLKRDWPDDIEIVDAGTSALDLLPYIFGVEKLIIVDALQGGNEPGSIYRLTPEDITMPKNYSVSLHQTNLLETLDMASRIGQRPPTVIMSFSTPKI